MKLPPPKWGQPFEDSGPNQAPTRIWRLCLSDLGDNLLETLHPLTTRAEQRRARKYQVEADQHRHLAGRGLVRTFLADRFDCAPQDPTITEGPHGKPQLEEAQGDPVLMFNIAHTEDVIVAAFSYTHPVGIDIEAQGREADMEGLVQRVFTASERQRWQKLSPARRPEFFFQIWTCKEAFLKATGRGLQRGPHTVECTFDGDTVMSLEDAGDYVPPSSQASATGWAIRPFSAVDGVIGAVVRAHDLPSPLLYADATHYVNQSSRSRRTDP